MSSSSPGILAATSSSFSLSCLAGCNSLKSHNLCINSWHSISIWGSSWISLQTLSDKSHCSSSVSLPWQWSLNNYVHHPATFVWMLINGAWAVVVLPKWRRWLCTIITQKEDTHSQNWKTAIWYDSSTEDVRLLHEQNICNELGGDQENAVRRWNGWSYAEEGKVAIAFCEDSQSGFYVEVLWWIELWCLRRWLCDVMGLEGYGK